MIKMTLKAIAHPQWTSSSISFIFTFSHFSLGLNGFRHFFQTFGHRRCTLVQTVIIAGHSTQCHDVRTGNTQHRQFRQFLTVWIRWNGTAECIECSRDRMDTCTFTSIGFNATFACHIFVIALWTWRSHRIGTDWWWWGVWFVNRWEIGRWFACSLRFRCFV